MGGGAGALMCALIFFASQALAGGTVATITPPLGAPAVTANGQLTTGSGCGAATVLVPPNFNLATGAGSTKVQATSCQPFGTHNADAWIGFNLTTFTCGAGCPGGPNELLANWTIPYKLTDVLSSCTGGNSGNTVVSNAVEANLYVFDLTTGGTPVASVGVQFAANNHAAHSPCGTTVVSGSVWTYVLPAPPPPFLAVWANLTPGNTYVVSSTVEVQSECETPNAASADCSATGDLTYLGGQVFDWVYVN